jgi:hypothetical protein
MTRIRAFKALAGLLAVFMILSFGYNIYTPLFEAPDEYYHFAMIDIHARTGGWPEPVRLLPLEYGPQPEHPWRYMAFRTPLYYALAAPIAAAFDTSDFSAHRLNPHSHIAIALTKFNPNFATHLGGPLILGQPTLDAWQGTALAVHAIRLFSMLLGMITLAGIFWLALEVAPGRYGLALLSALMVALIPQFVFIHSVVNDETMVIATSTLTLAALARLVRLGIDTPRLILVAVLAALAAISKESGMTLYPAVALGILYRCMKDRVSIPRMALYGLIGVGMWSLIAGWWYIGNFMARGAFTNTYFLAEGSGLRQPGVSDLGILWGLYLSFWGLFGWYNVMPPMAFFNWPHLLIGLALIGLMWRGWRGYQGRGDNPHLPPPYKGEVAAGRRGWIMLLLLALQGVIFIGAWAQFNQLTPGGQGRQWFPLLGIFALILAWGLMALPRWVRIIPLAGLAAAVIGMPMLVIAPAYTPAPAISDQGWQPPSGAVEMRFRQPWDTQECLSLWAQPPEWEGSPGSPIRIPLIWQSHCAINGYWSMFAHLVDLDQEKCVTGDTRYILAQEDTMPQGGRRPFPAFQPGMIVTDEIAITAPPDLDTSRVWHVQIGLYDAGGTFMRAFVRRADGQTGGAIGIGKCAPETVQFRLGG